MNIQKEREVERIMKEIKRRKQIYNNYVAFAKLINKNEIMKSIVNERFNSNVSDIELWEEE